MCENTHDSAPDNWSRRSMILPRGPTEECTVTLRATAFTKCLQTPNHKIKSRWTKGAYCIVSLKMEQSRTVSALPGQCNSCHLI